MQSTKPSYYDAFRCLADTCPDSCCREWAVVVDDESAARYRALGGQLGQRLREVMQEEDGDTILALESDRRCPMWQDDGLCRIQAQLGEAALCQTCRQFPRLRHDYGDFMELSLELSCPEAARLILSETSETITQEKPCVEAPDYDPAMMAILRHSRDRALSLLNDPQFSVPDALAILLLYSYAVQDWLDGGEEARWQPAAGLALARSLPLSPTGDLLEFCWGLNILTDRWRERLARPLGSRWADSHRALARYFVNRYWLQAVSDGDLICRTKLTVFSCLVIRKLGGDICQTAQLYSKEIENDTDNVDAILDAAYTAPALTDSNLLYLLLEDAP